LSVTCSVEGWGKWGHKMIAQIAQDMLNPTASNIVSQFLGTYTLADVAPIPDDYDHTPQGEWSKPCHFCNLPKDATNFTYNMCGDFCVVKSIFNYTGILANEQSNPFACDVVIDDEDDDEPEPCALIFLTHFVGDVHQPLHVGFAYDEGGNLVPVCWYDCEGKDNTTLHPVWDDNIIEKWNQDWTKGVTELEQIMQNEPALVKHYESITDAIDWADESFHYVLNTCYNYTDNGLLIEEKKNALRINDPQGYRMSIPEEEPILGDKYYNTNLPIVQQRLIAAGVRLGTLLNSILTGN